MHSDEHAKTVRFRIRRVPRRLLHRRTYEIDFASDDATIKSHHVTARPVALIDPPLGPGDAWSVVRAADEGWDGTLGQWVSWPPVAT